MEGKMIKGVCRVDVFFRAETLYVVDLLSIPDIKKRLEEEGLFISAVSLCKWRAANDWDGQRDRVIEARRAARYGSRCKK